MKDLVTDHTQSSSIKFKTRYTKITRQWLYHEVDTSLYALLCTTLAHSASPQFPVHSSQDTGEGGTPALRFFGVGEFQDTGYKKIRLAWELVSKQFNGTTVIFYFLVFY